MKFSIQFKYQNVNFKNTKTKETISFETKAQDGNTFIFDNVDEDAVIGILKGVKDKKSNSVFGYDDFRTCFINTMARNKCKELYDKIDKEGWKVEDIVVSEITLKDLEFTKPTMNARENITVESTIKKEENKIEQVDVIFKKDRRNNEIIAFFPDTMYDGSCNPGNLMSYAHIGQHSEASVDYYNMCRPATEEEYASLLHELE